MKLSCDPGLFLFLLVFVSLCSVPVMFSPWCPEVAEGELIVDRDAEPYITLSRGCVDRICLAHVESVKLRTAFASRGLWRRLFILFRGSAASSPASRACVHTHSPPPLSFRTSRRRKRSLPWRPRAPAGPGGSASGGASDGGPCPVHAASPRLPAATGGTHRT